MSESERVFRLKLVDLLIELMVADGDERSAQALAILREQREQLAPAQVVGLQAVTMTATRV